MNKSFCILPWIHIHPMPSGKTFPCCVYNQKHPVGNTSDNTLDEIVHSDAMNDIRAKMLTGDSVSGCEEYCIAQERHKNLPEDSVRPASKRIQLNRFFKDIIPIVVEQTNSDGSFKNRSDFKMRHLNIRFSNLCNFKCRSCDSEFSNLIGIEEGTIKKSITIHDNSKQDIMADVMRWLPDVELLMLAGGESVLVDEHWQVFDKLIELDKTDTHITLTTNLSKLSYKDKNLIDYVKLFKNFTLYVSIDAIGKRAELYRDGTVWPTIESNLRTLMNEGIKFTVNSTVGATNIHHITDTHRYLIDNGLIVPNTFFPNPLTKPNFLSSLILPQELKLEVTDKINSHIEYLKSCGYHTHHWESLARFMNSEDHSYLLEEFVKYNTNLDKIRNQDTFIVFPELKMINKA